MIETGTCSRCKASAERGSSGAWWHAEIGASCWWMVPTTKAVFVPAVDEGAS